MNLLEFLEGKKGENLATGALAYLLLHSAELRTVFFDLLSDISPDGPLGESSQFGFYLEDALSEGRIDLIVESDSAVIGIEAKFGAQFQDGQPRKYLDGVTERANKLQEARNRGVVQRFLVVLAPESREGEIETHVSEQDPKGRCVFLGWQRVFQSFESYRQHNGLGLIDTFLLNQAAAYVRKYIGDTRELARLLPHIGKRFKAHGSQAQKDLLELIWRLIPQELTKLYTYGGGSKHSGWYIYPHSKIAPLAWIGFFDCGSVKPFSSGVDHIAVGSMLFVASKNPLFVKQIPKPDRFEPCPADWQEYTLWRVPFVSGDNAWTALDTWQGKLEPIIKTLQSIATEDTLGRSSSAV